MSTIRYQEHKDKYNNLKNNKGDKCNLEPISKKFIKELENSNDPPIYTLPVEKARDVLNNLQKENRLIMDSSIHGNTQSNDIKIIEISISHDVPFTVSLVLPKNIDPNVSIPVVLYIHGGGWILGNIMTHIRLVKEIVIGANVGIVFVNYIPSPEGKYPVAISQCYKTLEFIQGSEFLQSVNHDMKNQLDTSSIGIIGDSVGGNMAISITELAIRKNGPLVSYIVLLYPVTDPEIKSISYKQFENGPWLTKKAMEWFWDAYTDDPMEVKKKNNMMSSLNMSDESLSKFPSTLIITIENDVLRDEGEQFAHKLMNNIGPDKDVYAIRVLGTIHDFLMLNPVASSTPTKGTIDIINMNLNKYLKKKKSV